MTIKKKRRCHIKFTYIDIAKATGLAPTTIKTLVSRGSFDPHSLESLANFIVGTNLRNKAKQK